MNMHSHMDELLDGLSPEDLLRELDCVDYENDFYEFFQRAWSTFDPSPLLIGPPLQAVAEHLQAVAEGDIRRLIINIPPRCGKTSLSTITFPAWVWARRRQSPTSGPGTRIIAASYGQRLSLEASVSCRRVIESPWYRHHWSHRFQLVGDQNTKVQFQNDKNGFRYATSVGSALTGMGGNIIIVDDPNAAQEAFSEATIQATIDWWDSALSTRINDPKTGAYIVIQQRFAEDDLTGHILSKDIGDWTHLMLPMRYESDRASIIYPNIIGWEDWREDEGEFLWPERFGEKETRALEMTLGPFAAAGQLQQRPEVKGGGVIKSEWWTLWEQETYPPMEYIIASLDTAYTIKQENDFSALSVWGLFSGDTIQSSNNFVDRYGKKRDLPPMVDRGFMGAIPNVMLMNCWQERLELHELVHKVARTCKALKVDKLLIENKAAGISVAQELRRLFGDEGFGIELVDPKSQDKLARLYSVQHLFAEGMIWAPDKTWSQQMIAQVSIFPKGKHDDLVDTVSQALKHLRETGCLTRSSERASEIDSSKQYKGRDPAPLYPA